METMLYPVKAELTAKEKRYQPIKHYVYIVEVIWSDGNRIPIYRHCSDFTQLHQEITEIHESLPQEQRKEILLPEFPTKKLFERLETRRCATVRRHVFTDYCTGLFNLDDVISKSQPVLSFFKCRDEDINPVAPKPEKPKPGFLRSISELFSKKDPAADENLTPEEELQISGPIISQTYIALADYTPENKMEMKLVEGMHVDVVEKYDNGWWFVQSDDKYGWAPATYLAPVEGDTEEEPEPATSGTQKWITVESYKAESTDEVTLPVGVLVRVLHRLLDGWWIIDYKGKVGYAPACYLVPFNNPHYRGTVKYGKTKKKPTKRGTTIKNQCGTFVKSKRRDLSIYKKLSNKISEDEAKERAARILSRISKANADAILNQTDEGDDYAGQKVEEDAGEEVDGSSDLLDDVLEEELEENDQERNEDPSVHTFQRKNSFRRPKGSDIPTTERSYSVPNGDTEPEKKERKSRPVTTLGIPGYNPQNVGQGGFNRAPPSPRIRRKEFTYPVTSSNEVTSSSDVTSSNDVTSSGTFPAVTINVTDTTYVTNTEVTDIETRNTYGSRVPEEDSGLASKADSRIQFIHRDYSDKINGFDSRRNSDKDCGEILATNNNNGESVQNVVAILVSALQNKTIACIKTNENGELVVSFNDTMKDANKKLNYLQQTSTISMV